LGSTGASTHEIRFHPALKVVDSVRLKLLYGEGNLKINLDLWAAMTRVDSD